ncbi:MAG: four helix bundle suffix domain-containing protein [Bacteroidia bacterium]|nr:four helix bundle suffix domain-containing protein [Bacteroidia bacterium]
MKDSSKDTSNKNRLIQRTGHFEKLLTYQKSLVIYDLTFYFCHKYLERGDRTIDQMIQAARSGKQNIAEGSSFSATSKKLEMNLINVAKSSLKELRADYEDYLRTRGHRIWEDDSDEVEAMKKIGREYNSDVDYFMNIAKSRPPETVANMIRCLILQNDFLLFRQLEALERDFLREGGFSERMSKMRKEQLKKQQ